MNKTSVKKIIDHPDRDEIVSKLVIGISPKDIYEWLSAKYTNASEAKFVIAEKSIKSFQDNYLDVYTLIRDDFAKAKTSLVHGTSDSLDLAIKSNPDYKNLVIKTVGKELELKQTIERLITAIETRLGQIYDSIQEDPQNINTRIDRLLREYADTLANLLEKAYKIINNGPDQIIQHNVTVQHLDQHTNIFYEAIKKTLERMDLESSMFFMEQFTDNLKKLKDMNNQSIPPVEERLAQVQILNETINSKING